MFKKRWFGLFVFFCLVFSLFLFLFFLPSVALALAPLPEEYLGTAFFNDRPADNLTLSVKTVDGELLASQLLPVDGDSGNYHIFINFDDPVTVRDEGADPGQELVWQLNGLNVSSPFPGQDTALPDNINEKFDIFAYSPPQINFSLSSNLSTSLNQSLPLDVFFENQGLIDFQGYFSALSSSVFFSPSSLNFSLSAHNSSNLTLLAHPASASCGSLPFTLIFNYSDAHNYLSGSLEKSFNLSVHGPDLVLINLSSVLSSGTYELNLLAQVTNFGRLSSPPFNVLFFHDDYLVENVSVSTSLYPYESIGVNAFLSLDQNLSSYNLSAQIFSPFDCSQENHYLSLLFNPRFSPLPEAEENLSLNLSLAQPETPLPEDGPVQNLTNQSFPPSYSHLTNISLNLTPRHSNLSLFQRTVFLCGSSTRQVLVCFLLLLTILALVTLIFAFFNEEKFRKILASLTSRFTKSKSKKVPSGISPPLKKGQSSLLPYHFLLDLFDITEALFTTTQTLEQEAHLLKQRYPAFLVNLALKNTMKHLQSKPVTNPQKELARLGLFKKEYEYVPVKKLEKAAEIIAVSYRMKYKDKISSSSSSSSKK